MRGEYVCFHSVIRCMPGSPPLARGILSKYGKLPKPLRITPACAGNTASGRTARIPYLDHPRLRGEYGDMSCNPQVVMGSPPLARGIPFQFHPSASLPGITPACAGNTLKKSLIYNLFPISISKFHLVSQTPEML